MTDTLVAWREPVFVTGAAGFIGRHLVERLLRDGAAVRALLLAEEAVPPAWPETVEIVRGDVADAAGMEKAVSGAGTVVHLAAVVVDWGPEGLYRRVTVGGTENVLRAAAKAADAERGGPRVVLASSIVVYGDNLGRGPCGEERRHGRAFGPYSRAKQAQEDLARELAAELDLELVVVRPANVFGVGSGPWVEMVLPLLEGRQPTLIAGGELDAGLCHVRNLVQLLALAATRREAVGRIYNGADGSGVTWRRYFGDLARIAGLPEPRSIPRWVAGPLARASELAWRLLGRQGRPPITLEALNLVGSHHRIPIERAREELGYEPTFGYAQAIEELERSLGQPG
ncbi:MAG: NAD-dependent epimerase/dehydratase family protein [Holophagales bacterium]|nr:NAD-dependent epimerase/dehydratase family protein [Holophagales bacterium]